MAAGYSNHLCAYCQERQSTPTGDHIFARSFFGEGRRGHLPKAPACSQCNGRKSEVETYLTAVLPFGGLHQSAKQDLEATAPRLAKNQRLKSRLQDGMSRKGEFLTLPLDGAKLEQYFEMATIGLLWHHGRRYLPRDYGVLVVTPSDSARDVLLPILNLRGDTVASDLGSGTFRYQAVTAIDDPVLTIWEFQMMGGLRLLDDSVEDDSISRVITFTAPNSSIERLTATLAAYA